MKPVVSIDSYIRRFWRMPLPLIQSAFHLYCNGATFIFPISPFRVARNCSLCSGACARFAEFRRRLCQAFGEDAHDFDGNIGKSDISLKNCSLPMRRASTLVEARTVAVLTLSQRMAISPTMALPVISATFNVPDGESTRTSTLPVRRT